MGKQSSKSLPRNHPSKTKRRKQFGASSQTCNVGKGEKVDEQVDSLDQFSTSQKAEGEMCLFCIKNAPFFAFKKREGTYGIVQGCCNDWNCPRCGVMRAKKEYGRIVEGCRKLATEGELWFITITCKGREIDVTDAERHYLEWTNKLLSRWRANSKVANKKWCYVAVTERQNRGHPHSHILTTWSPNDIVEGAKEQWKTDSQGEVVHFWEAALRSEYTLASVCDAGLGSQYDISRVEGVEAASRYVAKYLFKPEILSTVWPKGWKRVRYAQNFPKLPLVKTDAFVLLTPDDWRKLARVAVIVRASGEFVAEEVRAHLRGSDTIVLTD